MRGKSKWLQLPTRVKIGALAILKEYNSLPLCQRVVRVTATHPRKNGVVRVFTLRTSGGTELIRPIVCPLPDSNWSFHCYLIFKYCTNLKCKNCSSHVTVWQAHYFSHMVTAVNSQCLKFVNLSKIKGFVSIVQDAKSP